MQSEVLASKSGKNGERTTLVNNLIYIIAGLQDSSSTEELSRLLQLRTRDTWMVGDAWCPHGVRMILSREVPQLDEGPVQKETGLARPDSKG